MDGEKSSPEGGPDTPPNTPVTPSHKTSKERHKQWKDSEKSEPEPAACLGQHHHQGHHRHSHHHHNHQNHHNHHSNSEKKSSSSSQGACDVRTSNDSSSMYSCYHAHWCAASTPSTPSPTPTRASSSFSFSSNCSSDEDASWQQAAHPRNPDKTHRRSTCKSLAEDNDDADIEDQDNHQDQDQDHSGILPNPGTRPFTTFSPVEQALFSWRRCRKQLVNPLYPVHRGHSFSS